ncbi:hypothetical protein [[Pseudomonas] boreopolis]|uniref:hypothetical protein n=1 Tax=Xanthomonas boreopolis TaxID=86183 RepID=UPI003DA162F0
MGFARKLAVLLLAVLALLPNFMSSIVWGAVNMVFALIIVGATLALAVKARPVAKWAIAPLAAVLVLPPYPYWIFQGDDGSYHLIFNRAGIDSSVGFFAFLFAAYLVIFLLIYLLLGRSRPRRA